jgi:hypothetical protein
VRGTSIYSRVLVTASATSWLDLYGQFLYSQPKTTVNYQQYDGGNLYLQSQILFYSSQQYLVSSAAQMPHTTGNAGAEIRPWHRIRITESWTTDRLHNAGSSVENQTLAENQTLEQQTAALLESTLVTNYNQAQAMLFFEATPQLTLRIGYRYVWGDANDAVLPAEGLAQRGQRQAAAKRGHWRLHLSTGVEALVQRRRRERIQRRRIFSHQLIRLSKGPRAGALPYPGRSASRRISIF